MDAVKLSSDYVREGGSWRRGKRRRGGAGRECRGAEGKREKKL